MALKDIVQKYKYRLGGFVLGFLGGFWGAVAGFLAGLFVEIILNRKTEEKKMTDYFNNPSSFGLEEPVVGTALLCAIAYKNCGDRSLVLSQLKKNFGAHGLGAWESCIQAVIRSENAMPDLLTECLAVQLRNNQKATNTEYVDKFFKVLMASELRWDDAKDGLRPSAYLSQLLQYTFYSEEYIAACNLLGVEKNASLETIKAAHRKFAALYHPDVVGELNGGQQKIASEAFLEIQKAYQLILARHH